MSEPQYVEVNGQVWVRTSLPQGVRYHRLERARVRGEAGQRHLATLERLREKGEARELTYAD